jgi:hypothetical protein
VLIPTASSNDEHGPPLNIVPLSDGSLVNAVVVYDSSQQAFPAEAISIQRNFKDNWDAVVLNSSLLPTKNFSTIQDQLVVTMNLNYNSSQIPGNFVASQSAITTNFEIFDPRLSLQNVYECEIATYPRTPVFADNRFSISAEHITDRFGLVIAPDATQECGRDYHALLTQRSPPYSAFTWGLESSVPTVANVTESCDVAFNPENACQMSISLSFGSHLIRSSVSRPGISHLEMWLNAGAITGTVQFFAWFLEILIS